MAGKPVHGDLPASERWHGGTQYGCVWKHAIKKGFEPCDYAKNGYDLSSGSRNNASWYNKDHRTIAIGLGYLSPTNAVIVPIIQAHVAAKGKPKPWRTKWEKRIAGPFSLLEHDPDAWHISHTYTRTITNPWWRGAVGPMVPKSNFLPQPHGGLHYMFPYKHNYHHLIEKGSFHSVVLNMKSTTKGITPHKRKQITIGKAPLLHWNINNKDNIILLPNEVAHAETAGFPCHCPWSSRSHPKYSQMIKTKLDDVRTAIDKAVDTQAHPELLAAEKILEKTQTDLLGEVKALKGPL